VELKIIGPTSSQTIEVNWLEAQTEQGNFTILPGHAPLIIILAPNRELSMELRDGSTTLMTIAGGILEITRTAITLLLTHE
jgi:F0F1-type ATP synthase epsilon subunit